MTGRGRSPGRACGALLVLLALAACGGGGGGSASTVSSTTTPTSTTSVPSAPAITMAAAGDGSATLTFSAASGTVTAYRATCTAGSNSASNTGASSPLTIMGLTNGIAYSCTVTASNSAGNGPASAAMMLTPGAASTSAVDATRLPVGDPYVSTTAPAIGYAFVCTSGGGGGAGSKGPWFNADGTTWNSTTKLTVSGMVSWVSTFLANLSASALSISGNGLPSHTTGTFPIASTDAVYAYDKNPNRIAQQTIAWGLPGSPAIAATPSCLNNGAIGVLLTGARLYSPVDAANRDAVAWEAQDACQGHPDQSSAYHYHSISACLQQDAATKDATGQHSPLVGYAADGFGIYGNLGEGGKALTNADLDLCHGHTHAITINGVSVIQYHYHKTLEFPYALGCYRGAPARIS